jgi:hypothetical protein
MVKNVSDWRLCVPGLQEFGYFVDRLIQHGLVAVVVGQQRQEVGHIVIIFRCVSFIGCQAAASFGRAENHVPFIRRPAGNERHVDGFFRCRLMLLC